MALEAAVKVSISVALTALCRRLLLIILINRDTHPVTTHAHIVIYLSVQNNISGNVERSIIWYIHYGHNRYRDVVALPERPSGV